MKISEALRKGIEMSLPLRSKLTSRDDKGNLCACALGAIYIGNGGDPSMSESHIYDALEATWPELVTFETEVPEYHWRSKKPLEEVVWTENDTLKWDREQIADWLEQQGF